jgi:hypothetical protein
MDFDSFRNNLVSPALRAIADHWDEARGLAAMPSWEQLRPARMAPYLSLLWAYKYDAEKDEFTGRLAGNAILCALQKGFRGARLTDVWAPDAITRVHRKMLHMIRAPEGYRKTGSLFRHGDHFITGERMALPLASDGVHGDGMLGASDFQHPYPRVDLGELEMLDGGEEWFGVTARVTSVAVLQPEH